MVIDIQPGEQPFDELQRLEESWRCAPPVPDLSRFVTSEVAEDTAKVAALVQLDSEERIRVAPLQTFEHEDTEVSIEHYEKIVGEIVPNSDLAHIVIRAEIRAALERGESVFAAVTQRRSARFLDDVDRIVQDMSGGSQEGLESVDDATSQAQEQRGDRYRYTYERGQHIGPYTLRSPLGHGGFGEVWKATRSKPEMIVALKLIRADRVDEQSLARFEQERQHLADFTHDSIAKIHDAGLTDDGLPYFAMEYVQGERLTDYCDRHNLTIAQRLDLFADVCDAVHHAHMNGVIHRDLSPDNILVSIDQEQNPIPKVIDFGVSKSVNPQRRPAGKSIYTELHTTIGKFEYMAPEQAEGGRTGIDTRADVYSLGVILYELIVGELPLTREELRDRAIDELISMIRFQTRPEPATRFASLDDESKSTMAFARGEEDIADLVKALAGRLRHIPMTAMRNDRAQRFNSAAAMAADIRNYLSGTPFEQASQESRWERVKLELRRNPAPYSAAVIVFVVLIIGIVVTTFATIRALDAEDRAKLDNDAKSKAIARMNVALREKDDALDDKDAALNDKAKALIDKDEALDEKEEQREIADQRRQEADDAKEEAQIALAKEEEARLEADDAKKEALDALAKEETARREAQIALEKEEAARIEANRQESRASKASYQALAELSYSLIRQRRLRDARRILDSLPPALRGWESDFLRHATESLTDPLFIGSLTVQESVSTIAAHPHNDLVVATTVNKLVWIEPTRLQVLNTAKHSAFTDSGLRDVVWHHDEDLVYVRSARKLSVWRFLADEPENVFEFDVRTRGICIDSMGRVVVIDDDKQLHVFEDAMCSAAQTFDLSPLLPEKPLGLHWLDSTPGTYLIRGLSWAIGISDLDDIEGSNFEVWSPGERITAFHFDPDQNTAVTGHANGEVRIWTMPFDAPTAVFRVHRGFVRAISAVKPGHSCVSVAEDGSVVMWGLSDRTILDQWDGHQSPILSLGVAADQQCLILGNDRGEIQRLWLHNDRFTDRDQEHAPQIGTVNQLRTIGGLTRARATSNGSHIDRLAQWMPDGSGLVIAGWRDLEIWDPRLVPLHAEIRLLEDSRAAYVSFGDVHPDSEHIAFVVNESDVVTALVKNIPTGETAVAAIPDDVGGIQAMRWSLSGEHLHAITVGGELLTWRFKSGELDDLRRETFGSALSSIAPAPEGPELAIGGVFSEVDDQNERWGLKIVNGDDESRGAVLGRSSTAHSIEWSPDARWIAAGDDDGKVYLIRAEDMHVVARGAIHGGEVTSIVWHPSGNRLASGSHDGTCVVLDSADLTPMLRLTPSIGRIFRVEWDPSGETLLMSGENGEFAAAYGPPSLRPRRLEGHLGGIQTLKFEPRSSRLASASMDRTVGLWNPNRLSPIWQERVAENSVFTIDWMIDGALVAFSADNHWMRISAESGDIEFDRSVPEGIKQVWAGPGPSFDLLVVKSRGTTVLRLLRDEGVVMHYVNDACHTDKVTLSEWSPDGSTFATASHDGTLKIWSWNTGTEHREIPGVSTTTTGVVREGPLYAWEIGGDGLEDASWHPDGSQIVVSCRDGTAHVIETATGKSVSIANLGGGIVYRSRFSPDGRFVASGAENQRTVIWDPSTGLVLLELLGHDGAVYEVEWSDDSRWLASGGPEGTVLIWDLKGNADALSRLMFRSVRRTLARTAVENREVRLQWLAVAENLAERLGAKSADSLLDRIEWAEVILSRIELDTSMESDEQQRRIDAVTSTISTLNRWHPRSREIRERFKRVQANVANDNLKRVSHQVQLAIDKGESDVTSADPHRSREPAVQRSERN